MKKLAILGAGSWGCTLAWLSGQGLKNDVILWDRHPEKIAQFKENRELTFPVSVTLPKGLRLTDDLDEAVNQADAILLVVTTAGTREVCQQLQNVKKLGSETVLVNASKGIEMGTHKRLSQVLSEFFPENPVATLSGPTLAKEILNGLPTAAVVSAEDPDIAEYVQVYLSHEKLFRLYSNTDVIGTELGGALKNIFAIASGYMRTKNLGDNAQAALVTRGLAEMTRFSVGMGADPKTLYGLSGLGDLLATCNSPLSRNYQVGAGLAQGQSLEEVLTNIKTVAEGVKTTQAVHELSQKAGIETPIINQIAQALSGKISIEEIVYSLMSRTLKSEQIGAK